MPLEAYREPSVDPEAAPPEAASGAGLNLHDEKGFVREPTSEVAVPEGETVVAKYAARGYEDGGEVKIPPGRVAIALSDEVSANESLMGGGGGASGLDGLLGRESDGYISKWLQEAAFDHYGMQNGDRKDFPERSVMTTTGKVDSAPPEPGKGPDGHGRSYTDYFGPEENGIDTSGEGSPKTARLRARGSVHKSGGYNYVSVVLTRPNERTLEAERQREASASQTQEAKTERQQSAAKSEPSLQA